jgi:hypothetical protein
MLRPPWHRARIVTLPADHRHGGEHQPGAQPGAARGQPPADRGDPAAAAAIATAEGSPVANSPGPAALTAGHMSK